MTQWTRPSAPSSAPPPPAPGPHGGLGDAFSPNGATQPGSDLTAADLAAIRAIEEADAREEEQRRQAREREMQASASAISLDSGTLDDDLEVKAHEWVANKDAAACFLTGTKFTLTTRRHHCRYW